MGRPRGSLALVYSREPEEIEIDTSQITEKRCRCGRPVAQTPDGRVACVVCDGSGWATTMRFPAQIQKS